MVSIAITTHPKTDLGSALHSCSPASFMLTPTPYSGSFFCKIVIMTDFAIQVYVEEWEEEGGEKGGVREGGGS